MSARIPARAEREKNVMIQHRKYPGDCDNAPRRASVSPRHLRYRGIGMVWATIFVTLMILLMGLMLDTGKVAWNIHQLQNAADAAALAGARIVKVDSPEVTRQVTHDIGFANAAEKLAVTLRMDAQPEPFVSEENLDIILGRWINHLRYFFPTLDTPDAVKVIARRADGLADAPALALVFGPMAGVDTSGAQREAVAWSNAISGAGLIVLDEWPDTGPPTYAPRPGLLVADHVGDIRVIGGSIHVNARWEGTKSGAALYVKGGGRLQCARLTLQGRTDPVPGSDQWNTIWGDDDDYPVPYDIWERAPYLPDPLEYLVPPDIPTDTDGKYIVKSYDEKTMGSCTLEPGYYPGGIEVTATGTTVTLNPGTYLLGGGNLNKDSGLIQTGGTLIAHGVLIYLTKDYVNDADGRWAQLDVGGNVVTDITPPGDEVDPKIKDGLPGISIWQDRLNTANTASLHGGAGMNISGTLYFPKNHVYLAGNPGKAGNQILCGSIEVFGKAQVQVDYDGRNNMSNRRSILVR